MREIHAYVCGTCAPKLKHKYRNNTRIHRHNFRLLHTNGVPYYTARGYGNPIRCELCYTIGAGERWDVYQRVLDDA